MPFKPGRTKTGGRVKGTPNEATIAARLAEAEAALKRHEGPQATEMPLDLMQRLNRLELVPYAPTAFPGPVVLAIISSAA
jgi:hypothetical protein